MIFLPEQSHSKMRAFSEEEGQSYYLSMCINRLSRILMLLCFCSQKSHQAAVGTGCSITLEVNLQ